MLKHKQHVGRIMFTSFGIFALATVALATSAMAAPNVVANLAGRWTGWGSLTLANGASEQVRCVATYLVDNSGRGVQQNLRCASASYKIDAKASLDVSSQRITGAWEERIYSAAGDVSGRVTDAGFNLSIRGNGFSAAMSVKATRCKQSITIQPQGISIGRIAIGLTKC